MGVPWAKLAATAANPVGQCGSPALSFCTVVSESAAITTLTYFNKHPHDHLAWAWNR